MTEAVNDVSRETTPGDDRGNVSRETGFDRESERDGHGTAITDRSDDVSRETSSSDWNLPAGLMNSPLAAEAAQAVEVRNMHAEVWPRPDQQRVIAIANQKGGVGKTTSTVNLAAALAMHGLRVLVFDLDPQGNASTALGVAHPVGTPSVYDVLMDDARLDDVTVPVEAVPGLFCAPATIDLAGAEVELTTMDEREFRLRSALATRSAEHAAAAAQGDELADYDYVLIDCPPSLGQLTLNGLVAARELLLPIQCEYYALEGLAQLLGTVDLVRAHLNPGLAVRTVLLTMYDARTRLADQVAAEVRRHFGELVLPGAIPRGVRVSEAPGFGQTVMTYDPGSRGAVAYLQAARHIAHSSTAQSSEAQPSAAPSSEAPSSEANQPEAPSRESEAVAVRSEEGQ